MKRVHILTIFLSLILILCACQDAVDPSTDIHTSGKQVEGSDPQWSVIPKPSTGETTLPENCDNGHTFPDEAPCCALCGIDYYNATLGFRLSDDGTYYLVDGFGSCKRTTVIVPETHNGLPVAGINTLTTYGYIGLDAPHTKVTHVVLPDSIKILGRIAFYGYRSLVSINLPDGIERIEEAAFDGCESLVSLTLPDSVTYIGKRAFACCIKLKNLYIPDGVTEFGESAFYACEALEEIKVPDEMTEIPYGLASHCKSLKKITYGKNVSKIGANAFQNCISLQEFIIGENVTQIGSDAFDGCKSLTNIIIPDAVTVIGMAAFENCTALTSIVIPDGVSVIEARLFYKCENLETVVIGAGVKKFMHAVFDDCPKLKAIYYRGTQAQWEQIEIRHGPPFVNSTNPNFENVEIYFLAETQPGEDGNYWHYADGIPTPWKPKE